MLIVGTVDGDGKVGGYCCQYVICNGNIGLMVVMVLVVFSMHGEKWLSVNAINILPCRAHWNNLSEDDKVDHQEYDKNRMFGQLG